MRWWTIGAAVALLAGCGGGEPDRRARAVFEHQHVDSGQVYIEGFLQFVEVRAGGEQRAAGRFERDRLEVAVPAGEYTLVSYSRPCSAHCDLSLDPPRAFCERRITIRHRETRAFTVRTKVAARCSIRSR